MKAVVAALLANMGIAVAKFVACIFTGSSSMLSEAIHSVANSGNQVLLLVGSRHSTKKADDHHNFGYGRRRYVYGFIVAIVLEYFSFRTAIREATKSRGRRSMAKFVRDARQPELPVILLEDAGALVGLVFALLGVGLAVITGDGRFDAMGAMAVGTLLVVIAKDINEAEAAVRAAVTTARYVFLEPDLDRSTPST